MQSHANQLAQLERHSNHLKEALTALHEEEDHSLQKQRRLVAAAEEEVWTMLDPQDLHVDCTTKSHNQVDFITSSHS